MNRLGLRGLAGLVLVLVAGMARPAMPAGELRIYFIDVEGGQSTLAVTPRGEALLIDAGFAGKGTINSVPGEVAASEARDAGRILAAMRDAGVGRIDYLLVTHFHRDHMGGITDLAQLVPIGAYIDHGSAYPPEQRARPDTMDMMELPAYDAYIKLRGKGRHLQPKPGDRLPLKGVEAIMVSSDRATLRKPMAGAGAANPACRPAAMVAQGRDDENPRSGGFVLRFGRFRFLDLGDLNSQPLYDLVCPTNDVGPVDVYLVAHHGNSTVADPATLAAFQPRVAVVNNGERKGGRRALLQMLHEAPRMDSWQLHVSGEGAEFNAPPERIANLDESTAHWLKLTARPDGSFTVVNGRTGVARDYPARR